MRSPIIVPDDDLKRLEKQFGPSVRQMGSWNSDGVFSYSSVPIVAVEEAAESLNDPIVAEAVLRLKQAPEPTKFFIELVQSFGPALIAKIAAAYQGRSLDLLSHREASGFTKGDSATPKAAYLSVSQCKHGKHDWI